MTTTTTEITPLESRIREVLAQRSLLSHPFYQAWTRGDLPLDSMREYARQYYHFEVAFPRFLSAIHTRTESPHIRQLLLQNLWDEEYGERNHPALWLEFAAALGLSAEEVKHAPLRPETEALIGHYTEVASSAPLGEALATLFAYEGQVPAVAEQKIQGLAANYGFTPDQYDFFTVHREADVAHSGAEMEAITIASDDDDAIVAATARGCEKLLSFLDGCYEMVGSRG